MNKRGVEPQVLVVLIIAIASAIVLFSFGYSTAGTLKENADVDTCRLSVMAQSQTKFFGKSVVKLDCPRRNIKIFENKVELNGKASKKYSFGKLTQEEVNKIAAEELRLCWYKMAEGNQNVFEESYIFGTDRTCLICSEIQFDEKIKTRQFTGIDNYLRNRTMPKSTMNYWEYLVRNQNHPAAKLPWSQYTPWGSAQTGKIYESVFNSNEKYLVYFLAYKPPRVAEFIGAYPSIYYIGLGKADKIREECDILMN